MNRQADLEIAAYEIGHKSGKADGYELGIESAARWHDLRAEEANRAAGDSEHIYQMERHWAERDYHKRMATEIRALKAVNPT